MSKAESALDVANRLGPCPRVRVEVVSEETTGRDLGFLALRSTQLRNHHEDGNTSAAYPYDVVERRAIDAVALILFDPTRGTEAEGPAVIFRASLRPPLAFRSGYVLPLPDPEPIAMQWELPAGLVEPGESGEEGLRCCAAREALEETGLDVLPEAFFPLGPPVTLSPGVIGERLYYYAAKVMLSERTVPVGDGSPVEEAGEVKAVTLRQALREVRSGNVADVKTEAGIRRFLEWTHNHGDPDGG